MKILNANPLASYTAYKEELDAAAIRVLESGWYICGKEVTAFEEEFAAYLGVGNCIGVASGTDALVVALKSIGVFPGDKVATVSHTAVATVAAIELCGAEPLLVDIDPDTFTMSPQSLEQVLKENRDDLPKAIIPVHLYGHPADMAEICSIAKQHDIKIIEDCAQAHGAEINGRKVGTFGDIAAFSFYPTKNLGAFGDGGAVVTDSDELAERVRLVRQYGWKDRYISAIPGMNSRLDEMQAALLRVRLEHLEEETEKRRSIAKRFSEIKNPALSLPNLRNGYRHVYHLYVVRSQDRDHLRASLLDIGIHCAVHFPQAVHQQPAYAGRLKLPANGLPETEKAAQEVLSLPMHPYLKQDEVDYIIEKLSSDIT